MDSSDRGGCFGGDDRGVRRGCSCCAGRSERSGWNRVNYPERGHHEYICRVAPQGCLLPFRRGEDQRRCLRHAAAWHFHYMLSLLGDKTVMLDDAGGTGLDALRDAGRRDVVLAASVEPYARATIEAPPNPRAAASAAATNRRIR